MFKKSLLVSVVFALLLAAMPANAQPAVPPEYICKPTTAYTDPFGSFDYAPEMGLIAIVYNGRVSVYDTTTIYYRQPYEVPGDTYAMSRVLFIVPPEEKNLPLSEIDEKRDLYPDFKVKVAMASIDHDNALIVIAYPTHFFAGIYTRGQIFPKEDALSSLSFDWETGNAWSSGSRVYLRWSNASDPEQTHYAALNADWGQIGFEPIPDEKMLPENAFKPEFPDWVSAQLSRNLGSHQEMVAFEYEPSRMIETAGFMLARSGNMIAACPDEVPVPRKLNIKDNPDANRDDKWYLPDGKGG